MQLRTFGTLGLESSPFHRPKPLLLLVLLALEGPTSRGELAELFFPESDDAADALSTTVRRLRSLGEVIGDEGGQLSTPLSCDALTFETLLNNGRAREALDVYQGIFLGGLRLSLSQDLETWVVQTRERLASKARQAHLELARQAEEQSLALEHIEAALNVAGAPELEASDLRHIYTLVKKLKLNTNTLERLEQEASSLGIQLSPPHNLPSSLTSFVGRETERKSLLSLLNQRDGRLVTLHGPGGVGKTRLALQLASDCVEGALFQDGIYVVALEPFTQPAQVFTGIAEALGLTLVPSRSVLEQLQNILTDKHLLVLLDNFEHLLGAASDLLRLLKSCPRLYVVVTSREVLKVEGEWLVPVTGLSVPDVSGADVQTFLEKPNGAEALQLFEARAKRSLASFSLTPETLPQVLNICKKVAGMPLAIELASAWVHQLPLAEIAEQLETLTLPTSIDRHHTLQRAFEHSWKLLTPQEQGAFRRLSVFQGGFLKDAALTVCEVELSLLVSLVNKSLLAVSEGRYEFHPLLHDYARQKCSDAEEKKLRIKHATYYSHFFARHFANLMGGEYVITALAEVAPELPNLRRAWPAILVSKPYAVVEAVIGTLVQFAELTGKFLEVAEFTNLQEGVRYNSLANNAILQAFRGFNAYRMGGEFHIQECLDAVALFESQDTFSSCVGLWLAWYGAGLNAWIRGNYSDYFERAYTVIRSDPSLKVKATPSQRQRRKIVEVLSGISKFGWGSLEAHFGNVTKAQNLVTEAITLLEKHHSPYRCLAYQLLGILYYSQGRFEEAEVALETASHIAGRFSYATQSYTQMCHLARVKHAQGNIVAARELCAEVQTAVKLKHDVWVQSLCAVVEGWIDLEVGHISKAQVLFTSGYELAVSGMIYPHALEALLGLAFVWRHSGLLEKATLATQFVTAHPHTSYTLRQQGLGLQKQLQEMQSVHAFTNLEEQSQALKIEIILCQLDTVENP
jgi:predicted ATPase/DNA-binding SARP family transcriptional activator